MEKYVVTGSLGHISRPLVSGLVEAGKEVTVITSNRDRSGEVHALGAKAAVGSLNDAEFLSDTLQGAEVVYTMIPPTWQTSNLRASQNEVAANYIKAIKHNNIEYVVNLSSVGAHLPHGVGPVNGIRDFEISLNNLPGLRVKHLRPGYFFYNFLSQIPLIQEAGIMGANFGTPEQKVPLVHTRDIATSALEELLNLDFNGNSIRNIVGDFRTGQEIATALGKAIGRELPWVVFTDQQQKDALLQAGVPETHASAYTEMGIALREGRMQEEVTAVIPPAGWIKIEKFAKEFSKVFVEAPAEKI
ncbi:MAG: NAD(P)H-binding protein [Chryseolinea sp.]